MAVFGDGRFIFILRSKQIRLNFIKTAYTLIWFHYEHPHITSAWNFTTNVKLTKITRITLRTTLLTYWLSYFGSPYPVEEDWFLNATVSALLKPGSKWCMPVEKWPATLDSVLSKKYTGMVCVNKFSCKMFVVKYCKKLSENNEKLNS